MAPEVSVVLPYRDAEETLPEAALSILAQRGVDLELIAVDDGSRDDGPAWMAAQDDDRIRRLSTGGTGLVEALRLGCGAARAPVIARMDGDDIAFPERLAKQLAVLRDDPTLGAVGTQVEAFPEDTFEGGMRRYVAWQNALVTPADHERDLFVESPLCHPSVMLRRDALEAVGGYRDEGWAEDYDLWLRLAAAGWRLAKVDEVLLSWRHRPGRETFANPRYSLENMRALKARFLAPRLLERPFVIWGAGATGRRLGRALEAEGAVAAAFVDIDPKKIGGEARGRPIIAPEDLLPDRPFVVVSVGAWGARDLIREKLAKLGYAEGSGFLCAA